MKNIQNKIVKIASNSSELVLILIVIVSVGINLSGHCTSISQKMIELSKELSTVTETTIEVLGLTNHKTLHYKCVT